MNPLIVDYITYSNSSDYSTYPNDLKDCYDGTIKNNCPEPKDTDLYEYDDNSLDLPLYSLPNETSDYILIDGNCYQYSGKRSSVLSGKSAYGSFSDCSDCKMEIGKLPQKHAFDIDSNYLTPVVQKYHLLSELTDTSEKWITSKNNHIYGLLNQSSRSTRFSNFYLINSNGDIVSESPYYHLSNYNFRFEIPFIQNENYTVIGVSLDSVAKTLSHQLKFKLPGESIKTTNSF